MKRAFTIIELLISISIIALVAAILTPVFQADWGDTGSFNTASEAGLPTPEYLRLTDLGLTPHPPASPCGYRWGLGYDNSRQAADYMWSLPFLWQELGEQQLRKYKENTLLVIDPWCNPSGTDWFNPYVEKRVTGLLLSGRVISRKRPGIPHHQDWWAPPPD